MVFLQLLLMLLVILVAAEVFTNALEHLGEKLGISEGVTGSIFAAVGTALCPRHSCHYWLSSRMHPVQVMSTLGMISAWVLF
jgi:hypothetical protein